MMIAEDGFLLVGEDTSVGDVIRALDAVKTDGYSRPRFVVVLTREDSLLGIVNGAALDWADPEEPISQQADLTKEHPLVPIDADDVKKEAAVDAGDGLALAVKDGRFVAILRPAELGIDSRVLMKGAGIAYLEGVTVCPNCGLEITHYNSLPRLNAAGQVVYRRMCPICNRQIGQGET